jgi:hypothetical protein
MASEKDSLDCFQSQDRIYFRQVVLSAPRMFPSKAADKIGIPEWAQPA